MIIEKWKKIKEYENYEISNLGNVRSLKKQRILKPMLGEYKKVALYKNGKRKFFRVHRLVAEAFLDNPNNYKIVNHIDGNKYNNFFSNLEWCTLSYNIKHSYDHLGRIPFFKNKNMNALTKIKISKSLTGKSKSQEHIEKIKCVKRDKAKNINQYDKNNNFIKTWNCATEIEEILGIKVQNIIRNCKGKRPSAGNYIWRYADDQNVRV